MASAFATDGRGLTARGRGHIFKAAAAAASVSAAHGGALSEVRMACGMRVHAFYRLLTLLSHSDCGRTALAALFLVRVRTLTASPRASRI
jgi:hypothetical protein